MHSMQQSCLDRDLAIAMLILSMPAAKLEIYITCNGASSCIRACANSVILDSEIR